mmetsp:Transcript_1521/g.4185  ORF Transcript_1521/g.4185 Transcript_1521/m.4185 type:complete len:216 (+) Transcript_1521:515-1162(+)
MLVLVCLPLVRICPFRLPSMVASRTTCDLRCSRWAARPKAPPSWPQRCSWGSESLSHSLTTCQAPWCSTGTHPRTAAVPLWAPSPCSSVLGTTRCCTTETAFASQHPLRCEPLAASASQTQTWRTRSHVPTASALLVGRKSKRVLSAPRWRPQNGPHPSQCLCQSTSSLVTIRLRTICLRCLRQLRHRQMRWRVRRFATVGWARRSVRCLHRPAH